MFCLVTLICSYNKVEILGLTEIYFLLGPKGGRVEVSTQVFFIFILVAINMQASIAFILAWSRGTAMCIDGRVVSMSDTESVGPGSISVDANRTFFSLFFLEVIKFFFSSFQSRMIYQNKSEK